MAILKNEKKLSVNTIFATDSYKNTFLNSLPVAVFTCDTNGFIQTFNNAAVDLWGHVPEIGKNTWFNFWKIFTMNEAPLSVKDTAITIALKNGPILNTEFIIEKTNGDVLHIIPYPKPIFNNKGEIIGAINTLIDITSQVVAREKIEETKIETSIEEQNVDLIKQIQFTQTLIDSSVDSVMVIDINEVIISLNKTAKDLFAPYIKDDIVGKTLEQIDPTTKSKPDWEFTSAALKGEYIYRKDIKSEIDERYFDIYYIPLKNENETYAIMLVIREVTESVIAKLEIEKVNKFLKERNRFIEAIIDNSQDWFILYDEELTLIMLNKACEQMLGLKKEDVIGKKLFDIFPASTISKFEDDLMRSIKGKYIQNDIYYSDATNKYLKNYITPLKDANEEVYAALVIVNDMTEFKHAEEKIKKTNILLSDAQRVSQIGSWEWDVKLNQISWTDELYRIFGVDKESFISNFDNYLLCIHPMDRKFVSDTIQKSMQTHQPFDIHHRIVQKDGTEKIIHGKGEVYLNKKNEIIRLSGTAQDVTEATVLENKLKQSEMRHYLMAEQIEDYAIIFLDPKGNVEDWNKGAQKIKGYTAEEIIGKHFSLFYPKEERIKKVPQKILIEAKANKKAKYEGWRVRKDGTQFWASVIITAITDKNDNLLGFSKLTRDLTEQKISEEEISKYTEKILQQNIIQEAVNKDLAYQKTFAESLIESSPLMIMAFDKNLLITTWNKKSEEHHNLKKEDVLGKHAFDILYEFNEDNLMDEMNEVLQSGKTLHYPKIQFKNKSGWGEFFVEPMKDVNNNIIGVLSIIKEITELVKTSADLEIKNHELQKSNKELASFSYIASHDLQEPLRKISMFTSRLQEKYKNQFSKDAQDYIEKIENSSKRMTTLIQDLLNYSRLINPEKVFEEVDLNLTLLNVLNDFELLIEQREAIINVGNLPVIECVPLQMNQLFYNLISNALKFSKTDEKPIITISARKISANEAKSFPELLNSKNEKGYYELIFKDNGIGFDQKYADQIFVIFKRLHLKTEYTGTGIGLGLSKKIIENHNGEIFCHSMEKVGSAFHIILPIKHIQKEL